MIRILITSIIMWLGAGQALAQSDSVTFPNVTANPDVLLGCLDEGNSGAFCLDVMTADCRDQNDLSNYNLEERVCLVEEKNLWHKLIVALEVELGKQLASVPNEQILGNAQANFGSGATAWSTFVDAHCRTERIVASSERDPKRAIFQDECERNLAAVRFDMLLRLSTILQR